MRRAAITGVGCVSGLGTGFAALADGLRAGHCAVGPLTVFDASAFPCRVGGEVPMTTARLADLVGDERLLAEGALRDRKLAFAVLAAREAWRCAGEPDVGDAWLSLGIGVENALFEDLARYLDEGGALDWTRDAALGLPRYRARSPLERTASAVADALGIGGQIAMHASACAAGAVAVAHAAALIERGVTDVVVAGAADSMLNPGGFGGMAVLGTTSPRAASDACRPFDRRRDGIAIGEGAAVFVVEELAAARARGARVYAEIAGWGSTQDAHRPSAPEPTGTHAAAAMRAALARARLPAEAIGYVDAHGTGTTLNDVAEARAIRAVFGAHADRLPVASQKGATGHLMAAAGALELAATLVAFDGFLPGTCNHEALDDECPIRVLGPRGEAGSVEYALSNSFGFGGQNASVILRAGTR